MVSELSGWRTFLGSLGGLLTSWELFFGNILEGWGEWSRTRRWWLIFSTAPIMIVLMVVVGMTSLFRLQSSAGITQSLLNRVDQKLNIESLEETCFESHLIRNGLKANPEEATDTVNLKFERPTINVKNEDTALDWEQAKLMKEVDLLLENASRLSPDNLQIKYRKALIAANRNEVPVATGLMKELALRGANGFLSAKAWCAISILGDKAAQNPNDQEQLEDYLRQAVTWQNVDPILLTVYSTILLKSGKNEKSLQLAEQAAIARAELYLPYAQLLKYVSPSKDKEILDAAKAAEQAYRLKLGAINEKETDRVACANAIILSDRTEVAMELLREGMGTELLPRPIIRRFLSDLCVNEYKKTNVGWLAVATTEQPISANVDSETSREELNWSRLLEAAEVDPDNPHVGESIAFQVRNRQTTPPRLNEILLRQLRNGTANTACRLLVAERYLERGKLSEARMLWEKILEKDPLCLPAMNNLSVTLSRDQPPDVNRSLDLIERAYRTYPQNAELCDSYGEVYMNLGRSMEAVSKYEEAVRIDPSRVGSRIKLATCYREAGLEDIAIQQEMVVTNIQNGIKAALEKAATEKKSTEKKSTAPKDKEAEVKPANTGTAMPKKSSK